MGRISGTGSFSGENYTRQRRRQAIYERRAKQLFRRKLASFAVLFFVLTALVFLRVTSAKKDAPPVSFGEEEAARTQAAPSAGNDGSAPDGAYAAHFQAALTAYHDAVYALQNAYRPATELRRSADAASFFEGYQPVMTADTARLPENPSREAAVLSDESDLSQGSADPVEDEAAAAAEDEFVNSGAAVLIDLDEGTVVAARNPDAKIYPASMTKILTLLVANEQMTDRSGTFTITQDITDHTFANDLSAVCWDVGETITVEDMEYGAILPSGADACIGLARYSVGSEEKLVELMNAKCEAMGLSPYAHFTNVTGMHDENEHCTVTDMAMILKAAVEYEHVLQVMRTGEYTTSKTKEHPDGVYFFNLFLDRTQVAEAEGRLSGTVVCAKTGYTNESRNCAASYYVSESGKHYICVTAQGAGGRRVVQDHINLYNTYAK